MKRPLKGIFFVLAAWIVFLFLQSVLSRFVVYSEVFSVLHNLLPAFVATTPPLLIAAYFCRALLGSHRPFVFSVLVLFLPILFLQIREYGGLTIPSYSTLLAVVISIIACLVPPSKPSSSAPNENDPSQHDSEAEGESEASAAPDADLRSESQKTP